MSNRISKRLSRSQSVLQLLLQHYFTHYWPQCLGESRWILASNCESPEKNWIHKNTSRYSCGMEQQTFTKHFESNTIHIYVIILVLFNSAFLGYPYESACHTDLYDLCLERKCHQMHLDNMELDMMIFLCLHYNICIINDWLPPTTYGNSAPNEPWSQDTSTPSHGNPPTSSLSCSPPPVYHHTPPCTT